MTVQGPLPVVDSNSIMQRQSILALQNALPPADIIFRDERADDFGVDGSLELLANGNATNIRAQVQLKGRSSTTPNADGAVPVQVDTSNLNYLLNGICPLYVLFRPEANELRFAFARDEWARLEQKNPRWREQGSVTLHFRRALTKESLEEIRRQIASEAETRRTLDERLNSMRNSAGHVVVDARTLEVTDSKQIVDALKQLGHTLTNSGLAKVVVERARLVPVKMLLGEPQAALAVAYAHFHLAQYYDASAFIRQFLQTDPQLDSSSGALLDALFMSVRRMLGELDAEQYEKEVSVWRKNAPDDLVVQYEISSAWARYTETMSPSYADADRAKARLALDQTLARGRGVASSDGLFYIELLELTLRQHEVADAMLDADAVLSAASHGNGDAHAARLKTRQSQENAASWLAQLKDLVDRTRTQAPRVHCEALLLRGHATLGLAGQQQLMALTGHGAPISELQIRALFGGIEETLQLAQALENRELELSVMQSRATALDIIGQADEATNLASAALKLAELSGCSIHARQLRQFISGEDRAETRLQELKAFLASSEEEIIQNAGDDQLLFMAKTEIAAKQLPDSRIPNAVVSLIAQRRLARDRRDWCKHIMLAEFQFESAVKAYAAPPVFKIVCDKFGHERIVREFDPERVSEEFREHVCLGCRFRSPDAPAPAIQAAVAKRVTRNQAKAARKRRRGRT